MTQEPLKAPPKVETKISSEKQYSGM